ncbi:MAG: hypothetical protein J5950_01575 [Clostridia bacterium]|nr:hypothetical protein [Clostridia bacterium]
MKTAGKHNDIQRVCRLVAVIAALICAVTAILTPMLPEAGTENIRENDRAGTAVVLASGLPSKYETTARTPVLNQKSNPLCWAYSTTDMLNINAVKQGIAEQGTTLYSAPMFARSVYAGEEYRIVDNPSLWYRYAGNVGYVLMAASVGKGLMYNERYPDVDTAGKVSGDAIYDVDGIVSEFRTFDIWENKDQKISKIKEWVYEFGAVSVSTFIAGYDSVRKLASTDAWDYTKISHAILIVGWDDSKSTDTGTGAFLIKNTWGTSWGDGGYAYISYRADLGRDIYAAKVEPAYGRKVLTHTEIMPQSARVYSTSEPASAVNVFTASEALTVTHAKVYIDAPGTVSVNVWARPSRIDLSLMNSTPSATATLSVSQAGFYTLELSRAVSLNAGDKVAAEFVSRTESGYKVHDEEGMYYPPDWSTSCSSGESYLRKSGGLTESASNFVGALVCTQKNPPKTAAPATQAPTPTLTAKPTATPTAKPTATQTPVPTQRPTSVPSTTTPPSTTDMDPSSDPSGIAIATQTPDVIPLGTDGEFIDPVATSGGSQSGSGSFGQFLKKLGRVVLIGVAVIVVGLVLIIALARAGKNKK